MRQKTLFIVGCLIIMIGGGGCSRTYQVKGEPLHITADEAVEALAGNLINDFEASHQRSNMTFTEQNRASIVESLSTGSAVGAIVFHPFSSPEWYQVTIGYESLAVITHSGVEINNLSLSDLHAIMSGQIINWRDVGGEDLPIVLILHDEESSVQIAYDELYFASFTMVTSAELVFDDDQLIEHVSQISGAMSIVPYNKVIDHVKVLAIDGHLPQDHQLYPISTSVVLVMRHEPAGDLHSFTNWLLSEEGQNIVRYHISGLQD